MKINIKVAILVMLVLLMLVSSRSTHPIGFPIKEPGTDWVETEGGSFVPLQEVDEE